MINKITITRKKQFAGSAIKYFVVLNLDKEVFNQNIGMKEKLSLGGAKNSFLNESDRIFPLTNGQTVILDALEAKNSFFIVAFTSAGRLFSEKIVVDDAQEVPHYSVTLKMGLLQNKFIVDKI